MEHELTCCVCLDLYKEPITLPCSHCLCCSCLKNIASIAANDPIYSKRFSCPTCRFKVQGRQLVELKVNKLLSNIVNAYRMEKDEVTGPVPQMVCCVHPTEQLLLYCESCKTAVCSYCVADVHYEHIDKINNIEHLIEDEKESVDKLLKETERSLREKKAVLARQKNSVVTDKMAAKKVHLSLVGQLKIRFTKVNADYEENLNTTNRELIATEKAIDSELPAFRTAFNSMTCKSDRHLYYKKLTNLRKELSSFSLSLSTNSSVLAEEKQQLHSAVEHIDYARQAIQSLNLLGDYQAFEQERRLEELIVHAVERLEYLCGVFERTRKKWDLEQDESTRFPETVSSVTNSASSTGNSTASSAATSGVQQVSSAEGCSVPAASSSSSSAVALAPEASLVASSESAQPSEVCEKLKHERFCCETLGDFLKKAFNAGGSQHLDFNPIRFPAQLPSDSSIILQPQQTQTLKQGPAATLPSSSSSLPVTSAPSCQIQPSVVKPVAQSERALNQSDSSTVLQPQQTQTLRQGPAATLPSSSSTLPVTSAPSCQIQPSVLKPVEQSGRATTTTKI